MRKLITSWDDGHPLDLKIAELLEKYKIPGIFYIPMGNREGKPVLKKSEIKELSKSFTMGGHTYSHADLTKLPLRAAQEEIEKGKDALEQIIGKRVKHFCYPKGHFNKKIKVLVKNAGFKYARNARILSFSKGLDNYSVNPHMHIYPHKFGILIGHLIKNRDFRKILTLKEIYSSDKFIMATKLSKRLKKDKFHLWGHSWEVRQTGYLTYLEKIFKYFDANR